MDANSKIQTSKAKIIKILLIEDNPEDAALFNWIMGGPRCSRDS